MESKDKLLLVFVKNPKPGKVKTRLASTLGNELALEIYQRLLAYTRDICLKTDADKEIWFGNEIPEKDLWSEAGFQRHQQVPEDLGSRMLSAFQKGFINGYKRIVIIGSDNAKITEKHIGEAFDALENHDAVIGPALDGGYYLLGIKVASNFDLSVPFRDKKWSSESVFADTMKDFEKMGLEVFELEALSDIDYEEDLKGTFLEPYMRN